MDAGIVVNANMDLHFKISNLALMSKIQKNLDMIIAVSVMKIGMWYHIIPRFYFCGVRI